MRDETYLDHADTVSAAAFSRSAWRAAVGAVASLALLGGVVTWTYRLGVRDAQAVPVIRALEGPARIRPDDPGGARFAHQGMSVYGALAGVADTAPETALAPPPEAPADEDRAPVELGSVVDAVDELDALVAAALLGDDPVGAPEPAVLALVDPAPQAPARSPAPPRLGAVIVAAQAPAAAAGAPAVSYAGDAPTGPMIQLGAYLTPQDASRMWREISGRNGDVLAGREPVLGVTEQNGRTLHLLRAAPFESLDEARALCGAMRARGEDCLTVRPR
ncbi:MAG: SPOR domain-containing protein [Rhodobacteraceae bacterium]|nr:MAG: SPOR domain-containing protein [Paracoccaceae bacterium]